MDIGKSPLPLRMMLSAYRIFAGIVDYFFKSEGKEGLHKVEGKVVDEGGEGVPGVVITLDGQIKIMSGKNGEFSLYLPKKTESHEVIFQKRRYKEKRIIINQTPSLKEMLKITLSKED
jgi:hypothetical protein